MTTVTKKHFQDWIAAQPDERPVEMNENYINEPCGCIMVQYGRENLSDEVWNGCGSATWENVNERDIATTAARFELDLQLKHIIRQGYHNRSTTFGELKKQFV